jgi:cellobiose transport system substrate-binding protein
LRPNYRGLKDADVRPEFGNALSRVEDKKQTVDEAWNEAVQNARELVK